MHSATPSTDAANRLADELKRELQSFADRANKAANQHLRDAALDLISALNYQDEQLVDSTFNSLLAAMAGVTRDSIARELAAAKIMKEGVKEGWDRYVNKKAHDIACFDELRDLIESMIDERVASMMKGRTLATRLKEYGHSVENAHELDEGIRDLRRFREAFFRGWPTRKPASPINKAAIAQAREAIARGEKGMRKSELSYPSSQASK